MNWRDKQRVSDADAEIESTDGTSPDVENSLPSPSETLTTLPVVAVGGVVEAMVGVVVEGVVVVVGIVVVVVGDKAIKDVMKQPVHLQKRDGQRVAVCKFSLSQ